MCVYVVSVRKSEDNMENQIILFCFRDGVFRIF